MPIRRPGTHPDDSIPSLFGLLPAICLSAADIGMPATRDDMRELRDDRALLNENGELRHQNEFMRSLGSCVCERDKVFMFCLHLYTVSV